MNSIDIGALLSNDNVVVETDLFSESCFARHMDTHTQTHPKMSVQIEKTLRVDEANNTNHNITVKFLINEFETVAQVYAATVTVGHVLKDIATKFKLPSKYVTIRRDDHVASKIPYGTQLHQICRNAIGIVTVILRLSELADEINDSVNNEHERIKLDCDVYYRFVYSFLLRVHTILNRNSQKSMQSLSIAGFHFGHNSNG